MSAHAHHDATDVRRAATGQWPGILVNLGIDATFLRNRHGACPACGGRDRFRFDDRDGAGTWYCNHCGGRDGGGGAGDGVSLLMRVNGWTYCDAVNEVGRYLCIDPAQRKREPAPIPPAPASTPPPTPPHSKTADYALSIWGRANKTDRVVGDHPYCISKRITWAAGAGRARASGKLIGRDADCLVVPIRDLQSNAVVAVQVINAAGKKQSFGPVRGNGLVLGNTLDRALPWYVTEGWADAVTMCFHRHGGNAVACAAFGLSSLDRVATRLNEIYQPREIIVLRDAE